MKKVVYNITRYRQHELIKISGLGYITDTDLIIACTSKEGKPYIRVFGRIFTFPTRYPLQVMRNLFHCALRDCL